MVTGCCGLGHDLLGKGGFSELFPRVGSLKVRVSRSKQPVLGTGGVELEVV